MNTGGEGNGGWPAPAADFRSKHVISAASLVEQLDSGRPPVLLDIRFRPGLADPQAEYDAGHLPGAHYVHLPTVLADAGPHRPATDGALPLPRLDALQQSLRSYGINDHSRVVVYDNRSGLSAARAWWVLRWAGLTDVLVLDGGYGYWLGQGLPTSTARPVPSPGTITLTASGTPDGGHLPTISTAEATVFAAAGVLVDAREAQHFTGDAGCSPAHIPRARSLPSSADVNEHGLLLSDEALRTQAEAAGLTSGAAVAAYCGAGVLAAHKVLTLATLGIDASLYVGSWSAWSAGQNQAPVP